MGKRNRKGKAQKLSTRDQAREQRRLDNLIKQCRKITDYFKPKSQIIVQEPEDKYGFNEVNSVFESFNLLEYWEERQKPMESQIQFVQFPKESDMYNLSFSQLPSYSQEQKIDLVPRMQSQFERTQEEKKSLRRQKAREYRLRKKLEKQRMNHVE